MKKNSVYYSMMKKKETQNQKGGAVKIIREAQKGSLSYTTETNSKIIRETEKAICLSGEPKNIWIPKKAVEITKDSITIKEWFDDEFRGKEIFLLSSKKKSTEDSLEKMPF